MLGKKARSPLANYPEGSAMRARLERRLAEPTLWDGFLRMLVARGYGVPVALLTRDVAQPPAASPELQAVLIEIYRNDPPTRQVCELLVDLDEGVQEWRYRHVKMVQRTIGAKMGTGGSAGVEYLAKTLMIPLFPDLWDIRASL